MRKRSSRRRWISTRRRSRKWATRCRRRSPTTRSSEPTLTPAVKATRTKDLRDRQAAYQQHVQQLEQTAQQREAELVRPIMEQINKIIEQIRTENSYSFILDAGSQAGVVVAADSSLDITDAVIKRLVAAGPVAMKTTTPAADHRLAQAHGRRDAEADRCRASEVHAVTDHRSSGTDLRQPRWRERVRSHRRGCGASRRWRAAWRCVGARRARGGARPRRRRTS